ncbi:glycosyltransferase [Corallincola spongiicola]|nr:glycosyltransferase [Corallincola spongiicola]
MEKCNIAYLIDTLVNPNAGTEGQFIKLVQGMVARGHSVKIYALRGSPYLASNVLGVDVEVLNIHRMASPLTFWRLFLWALQLRREGVALVQTFFNDASVIAPMFIKFAKCVAVISRRDMGFWYTSGLIRLLRFNRRWVDGAIVNSNAVGEKTTECEWIPNSRVHVIYNGYLPPNEVEAKVSIPAGPVIGLVANIRPIKRMQDAVAALGMLSDKHPDLQLVIVGGGDPKPLIQQAEQLGVAERLHCVGGQKAPQNYIQRFDIALLCSESEGFSNAIIEYLQWGKPVVCTRTGGNPEIVTHGENGFLYPVGDVAVLAGHIDELLSEREILASMGHQACHSVATRFSMEHMFECHERLYHQLLKEAR